MSREHGPLPLGVRALFVPHGRRHLPAGGHRARPEGPAAPREEADRPADKAGEVGAKFAAQQAKVTEVVAGGTGSGRSMASSPAARYCIAYASSCRPGVEARAKRRVRETLSTGCEKTHMACPGYEHRGEPLHPCFQHGRSGGSRTLTPLKAAAFEAVMSAIPSQIEGAGRGSRTLMRTMARQILSLVCLPFHHPGRDAARVVANVSGGRSGGSRTLSAHAGAPAPQAGVSAVPPRTDERPGRASQPGQCGADESNVSPRRGAVLQPTCRSHLLSHRAMSCVRSSLQ